MTTKTNTVDTVEMRYFLRGPAIGALPESGQQEVPCGTDAQREHIAELIETGTWAFVDPLPEWHDARPVTVCMTGNNPIWIDRKALVFGESRYVKPDEVVLLRSDSPAARMFVEHLLSTSCELVGTPVYRWLPSALRRAAAVRKENAPTLKLTTPLVGRGSPQVVERRPDGSVGLTVQRRDRPAASGGAPASDLGTGRGPDGSPPAG